MKQVFGLASHPGAEEGLHRFFFSPLSLWWNWALHILQESITSNVFCKQFLLEWFHRITENLRLERKFTGHLDQSVHKGRPSAFVFIIATHGVAGESNLMHLSSAGSLPGWKNAFLGLSCPPVLAWLGYSIFICFLTKVLPMGAQGNPFPLPSASTCSLRGWIGLENSAGKVWGDEINERQWIDSSDRHPWLAPSRGRWWAHGVFLGGILQ